MKKLFAVGLILSFLAGCGDRWKPSEADLPEGAKNVRKVGFYWYVFEVDIDGKTYKFLIRNQYGYSQMVRLDS